MEGKRKYIEDCAKLIDTRVAALEEELAEHPSTLPAIAAGDRAAIFEARLLASLIRQLGRAPYKGDPYKVARQRRGRQGDLP